MIALIGLPTGAQFLMLGIVGAYLGRLYDQSKGRPLFMIRDMVGGAGGLAAAARSGDAVLAPIAYPPDYRDFAELRLAKPHEGVS